MPLRTLVHGGSNELGAEPAATLFGEHVDVGELREPLVAHDACEPHLSTLPVQADHAGCAGDLALDDLTRAIPAPVRLGGQERPDRIEVQPRRVVVELEPARECTLHGTGWRATPASSSRSVTSAA